jgi:ATP-dependent Lon protease
VATLEEDEYPTYYSRGRKEKGSAPEEPPTGTDPLSGAATPTEAPSADEAAEPEPGPELFEGHREYQEGQRGVSFDSLLVPYLRGATKNTIVDPYVRMFHQARNLMELVEGIARGKDPADEVTVKLVTVENQDGPEKAQRQLEYLLQIKKSAGVLGIVFDVDLVEPAGIHDRSITTDTGWKILLGRGLDIFQRMSDRPFDLATKYQKYRELKAFGITYLQDADKSHLSGSSRQ